MYGGGFGGHPTAALHNLTYDKAVELLTKKNGKRKTHVNLTRMQWLGWRHGDAFIDDAAVNDDIEFRYDGNLIMRLEYGGWVTLDGCDWHTQTTRAMLSTAANVTVHKNYEPRKLAGDDRVRFGGWGDDAKSYPFYRGFRINIDTGELSPETAKQVEKLEQAFVLGKAQALVDRTAKAADGRRDKVYADDAQRTIDILSTDGWAWYDPNRGYRSGYVTVYHADQQAAIDEAVKATRELRGQFAVMTLTSKSGSVCYRLAILTWEHESVMRAYAEACGADWSGNDNDVYAIQTKHNEAKRRYEYDALLDLTVDYLPVMTE